MNKKEFLDELRIALEGKLPGSDISEIISDYGDIFDNNLESGKAEETTSAELGSPARIARTIMEDGIGQPSAAEDKVPGAHEGAREYTDFQKNINEKTSMIFDKVTEPDKNVELEDLAPMPRRLGAYVIDTILLGVVAMGILIICIAPFMYMVRTSVTEVNSVTAHVSPMASEISGGANLVTGLAFGNMIILMLLFGALNLFTTIFLWATNGYTPGKWMLKMRVVKINGSKISFLDALLREVVIKGIANSVASGFLNIGSFIWGCLTDDRKTVQDLVAKTRVVTSGQAKNTSNPLES